MAADFGGDCCADLEERVAELEATTARKGNRKVSLTIYGQVNTAVMFWDNGQETNTYVVDNDISSTRAGFKGKAKITPDWSAGYKIELEFQSASSSLVTEDDDDVLPNEINIRKSEWYLQSKTYGKLTVGQGDMSNSGITEIDLSGTNVSALFDNIKAGQSITAGFGRSYGDFTGGGNNEFNRRNRVRYDTPTFAGFIMSAAWGEDDMWDVALRYAGALGDFKLAAGIAYGENSDASNVFGGNNDAPEKVLNGSFSVIHTPTGLFVTAGASQGDTATDNLGVGSEENFYGVRAGISQRFIPLGKTAFYGQYQRYEEDYDDGSFEDADVYGGGIVQKIDAAAMELYVDYKHIEVDDETANAYNDLDVVITGARIKF